MAGNEQDLQWAGYRREKERAGESVSIVLKTSFSSFFCQNVKWQNLGRNLHYPHKYRRSLWSLKPVVCFCILTMLFLESLWVWSLCAVCVGIEMIRWRIETMVLPKQSQTMAYTTCQKVKTCLYITTFKTNKAVTDLNINHRCISGLCYMPPKTPKLS